MVTGDIINGSTSIGILVIVYSLTDDSDNIHYHFIRHADVQQPRMYPVVMWLNIPGDEYEVAIFVMKEDGTPFHRAAATSRTVQIEGNYI